MTVLLPDLYVRAREKVLRGQMTYVNAAFVRLIEEVNRLIRQVITDHLMTLHLAGAEVLRLGRDLQGAFPQELEEIRNPNTFFAGFCTMRMHAASMIISFQSSHAPIVNDTTRLFRGSVWLVTRRPKGPSTM